ncbi:MAG: hypothetical protein Q7T26_07535 [Dehalococcoidia bacterium]|nr:hypothetical protein [Dehalococcoidia bacterium]
MIDSTMLPLVLVVLVVVLAIAMLVVALTLALSTRRFARYAEYTAVETSKHAAATARLAEATQRAEVAGVMPVLGLRIFNAPTEKEGALRFEVKNAGLGPALNAQCKVEGLGVTSEVWESPALGPGEWLGRPEEAQVRYSSVIDSKRPPISEAEIPRVKVSYEDVQGNSYESLFVCRHPVVVGPDGAVQGRLAFRRIQKEAG